MVKESLHLQSLSLGMQSFVVAQLIRNSQSSYIVTLNVKYIAGPIDGFISITSDPKTTKIFDVFTTGSSTTNAIAIEGSTGIVTLCENNAVVEIWSGSGTTG